MYEYQVECKGGEWHTFRSFDTEAELREFSKTETAHTVCWGRGFRWVGPQGIIDPLA